jgi:hypothetical protein
MLAVSVSERAKFVAAMYFQALKYHIFDRQLVTPRPKVVTPEHST